MSARMIRWWKQDKRYIRLLQSLGMGLLPVICCLIYCALQGKTLGQVYLPASEWNDELFYYKQAEGIVNWGFPQGYFGFNESHALRLSFAAWSPVLIFPWVLWGLVFGWNLMSPVACNIFLMSAACFLFVWLARPSRGQTVRLAVLFSLFTPFVRYMLSGMPEVSCFAMLILFYGLAVSTLRKERGWKLASLFAMSALMTWMRPYFLLCMLLPSYLWIKKRPGRGAAGSVLIFAGTAAVYAGIKHYLSADYFMPLFFTDWLEAFRTHGLGGGIRYTLDKLCRMGILFLRTGQEGIRSGMAAGDFVDGFLAVVFVSAFQSIQDGAWILRKKTAGLDEKKELRTHLILELHLLFSCAAVTAAVLLMYKLVEGSRHLLTFIAAGIFVAVLTEKRFYWKTVFLGLAFLFFFSCRAVSPYDFQVPFREAELCRQLEDWERGLENGMRLQQENAPCFDNVVIWSTYDTVSGDIVPVKWQFLYALPAGFGISCCDGAYVLEHFDTLQSRYLFAPAGGEIDRRCREAGYRKIWEEGAHVLYDRRGE